MSAESRRRAGFSAAGLLLLVLCLFLLNLLAARVKLRFDLSSGRLYSLSPGSRRVADALRDPLEVRCYFSKQLPPQFASARGYLRDLLAEYRSASHGKLRTVFVDVDHDDEGRREALAQGIFPVQFNVVSRERYEVREGFMGLSLAYADRREVLPVLARAEGLEYELTARIARLLRGSRPTLGLVSSRGAAGPERLAPPLREALERSYELRAVDLGTLGRGATVSAEVDALMLLGPGQPLDGRDIYALDQFLLSGRPLALAIDPKRADFSSFMVSELQHGLGPWLKALGVSPRSAVVLDEQAQKVKVSQTRGAFATANIVDYPPFPLATDLDPTHPAVRGLDALVFPLAAPIDVSRATGRVRTFARSSPHSWLRTAWLRAPFFSIQPLQTLSPSEGDPAGPFALAVSVEDDFTSFFSTAPGAPHPLPKGVDTGGFLARSARPGRLLLTGTARFHTLDMPAGEAGLVFLLNVADWLAQADDLSAIRAKAVVYRPLLEIPTSLKALVRWLNILLPSFLVAACGILRLRARKAERALLRALYAPADGR